MRLINKNSRRGVVNLFSEFVLSKINKTENSIIQVTDCGPFFVVNGLTTSLSILDLNKVRDEFVDWFSEVLTDVEPEPVSEVSVSSEFPYGHSLNCGRLMVYYSHYIFNHCYSSIGTDEVYFYFTKELDEDDDFKIRVITSKGDKVDHRVKSMILDVFDFNLEEFSSKLTKYDLIHDVLDPNKSKPYLIQDRLKDTILF